MLTEQQQENLNKQLILAVMDNNLTVVKNKVTDGADINYVDYAGYSPLTSAASKGHLEIVKYFISMGANVNQLLNPAASNGHVDIVKLCIEAGANVNHMEKRPNANLTPLHNAACKGHLEVVELLVQNGAVLDDETHTMNVINNRHPKTKAFLENSKWCGTPFNSQSNLDSTPSFHNNHGY